MMRTQQLKHAFMWGALAILGGCQSAPGAKDNHDVAVTNNAVTAAQVVVAQRSEPETFLAEDSAPVAQNDFFSETPKPQYPNQRQAMNLDQNQILKRLNGSDLRVDFNNLPIPSFINEVFGNILGLSFDIASDLKSKKDLVTLRTQEPQTAVQLYKMALQVLGNYGIAVQYQGDVVRFTSSEEAKGNEPPLMVSGRSLPDVPLSHRPIFQLVTLKAVRNTSVAGWLNRSFTGLDLKIYEDPERNAILLQGKPAMVEQAVQAIEALDQPFMRGRYSVGISPAYYGAEDFAKILVDVLKSEGYGADMKTSTGAILVLPIQQSNTVLVFASDRGILNHVKEWAVTLDRPAKQAQSGGAFYYQVQNTSAEELAQVLSGVVSGMGGEGEGGSSKPQGSNPLGLNILVDKNRNGLIFQGQSLQREDIFQIVKSMDKPARLVMVEVTIASVTLTDDTKLGVEWLFKDSQGGLNGVGQTSFGLSGSGFSYTLSDNAGIARAKLNAFAENQRVTILSKPSILVKSGESATIDVGEEIPILTSQAQSTNSGDTPIVQTVQYRKTGVLLKVEPVVHSGDRVDLQISQEVSEALDDATSSSLASPSIFTRKVETVLTMSDGGSVVLGGLISRSKTKSAKKVPGFGDIPLIGALFRTAGDQDTRRELMLLIQTYVLDEAHELPSKSFKDKLQLIGPAEVGME